MSESFRIAQISDLHFGDGRFDEQLLEHLIDEVNVYQPHLLIVPGDLTTAGYRNEYEAAKTALDRIESDHRIILAGNHDCRNVGNLFFNDLFGERFHELELDTPYPGTERIKVVALDSNKPDLNDGEIGRRNYSFIREGFAGHDEDFKIFVIHHHLVGVPGTGRERNIVWDAGDVLEELTRASVHMTLNGHKHVPYVWEVNGMHLITSGTATTRRTRGYCEPAYNLIDINDEMFQVSVRTPGVLEPTVTVVPRRRKTKAFSPPEVT